MSLHGGWFRFQSFEHHVMFWTIVPYASMSCWNPTDFQFQFPFFQSFFIVVACPEDATCHVRSRPISATKASASVPGLTFTIRTSEPGSAAVAFNKGKSCMVNMKGPTWLRTVSASKAGCTHMNTHTCSSSVGKLVSSCLRARICRV